MKDGINNQKTRLDTAISEFQQQFSVAQETRRNEFNEAIRAGDSELQAITTDKRDQLERLAEEQGNALRMLGDTAEQATSDFQKNSSQTLNDFIG
ncbi:MAG: hypothetical protein IIB15_03635, partial [Chloroflexi bacterium]|nr:hypothetical protein [Chloroflexota bacterium]